MIPFLPDQTFLRQVKRGTDKVELAALLEDMQHAIYLNLQQLVIAILWTSIKACVQISWVLLARAGGRKEAEG